jgi:hypothetical protein
MGVDTSSVPWRPVEAASGRRPPPPVVELSPRDLVVLTLISEEEEEEEVALGSIVRNRRKISGGYKYTLTGLRG